MSLYLVQYQYGYRHVEAATPGEVLVQLRRAAPPVVEDGRPLLLTVVDEEPVIGRGI